MHLLITICLQWFEIQALGFETILAKILTFSDVSALTAFSSIKLRGAGEEADEQMEENGRRLRFL
jgi:hypothetical protein